MSWCSVLVVLLSAWGPSWTAHAQQAPEGQRNNRSFFARTALGPGYVALESDPHASDLSIGQVGVYWDLSVGAKVWRELSLHGSCFGGWAWEPEIEQGGVALAERRGSKKSLSVLGLGPGATYHFLPANIFLSYSVGAGWSILQFHQNGVGSVPGWSNFGFANQIMLGKEWWLGRGAALGVAAQALFAHVKDNDDEPYNSFGGSLMLSATYH